MCHVHVPVCAMHVCFCESTDLKKKKMERLMQQSDITDTALVTAMVNVKPLH